MRRAALATASAAASAVGLSIYTVARTHDVESPISSSAPLPFAAASIVWGHWLDHIYSMIAGYGRGALHFSTGGWGDVTAAVEGVHWMRAMRKPVSLVGDHKVEWLGEWAEGERGVWFRDGTFLSPIARPPADGGLGREFAARLLNEESLRCHFRYVVPASCLARKDDRISGDATAESGPSTGSAPVPVALILACSGDQGFKWRDAHFATPLAKEHGVASIVIENAFYGARRPAQKTVRGAQIDAASDIVAGGLAVLPESTALLDWLTVDGGEGSGLALGVHQNARRCVSGISLGGIFGSLMACSCATRHPFDLVAVLPSPSAAEVYTKGSLSKVCDFGALGRDAAALETVQRALVLDTLKRGALNEQALSDGDAEKAVDCRLKLELRSESAYDRGVRFATAFLDATSHIANLPAPFAHIAQPQSAVCAAGATVPSPSKLVIIGAIDDAYIPAEQTAALAERWTAMNDRKAYNVTLRWWLGGHCSTVLTKKHAVRSAIAECLLGDGASVAGAKKKKKEEE